MAKILMHEHISVFSLSHRVFILLECINHFWKLLSVPHCASEIICWGASYTETPAGSATDRAQSWGVEGLPLLCSAALTSGWADSTSSQWGWAGPCEHSHYVHWQAFQPLRLGWANLQDRANPSLTLCPFWPLLLSQGKLRSSLFPCFFPYRPLRRLENWVIYTPQPTLSISSPSPPSLPGQ